MPYMFRFTGPKILFIVLALGTFLLLSPGIFTANSSAVATTTPPLATSTLPNAPANVQLTASIASSTYTVVNIKWTDTSNNEDGFQIDKSTDYWNFFTIGRLGAHNGSSTTMTFVDTAHHVGGYRYFYYIRAFNSYGTSSVWATIMIPKATTTVQSFGGSGGSNGKRK